jgi:hypothetical protein
VSWRTIRRGLYGPATVEHTVPPADVVAPTLDDTAESTTLERAARVAEALRLVEAALYREAKRGRDTGTRNPDLANLCLEVRSALRPSPPGSEVLHEAPPRFATGGPLRPSDYRWYGS